MSEVVYSKKQVDKKWTNVQMSTMTRSFLIAGISFLLICAIGLGFGYLIQWSLFNLNWSDNSSLINGLWAISIILIIVSTILSMLWQIKITKASKTLIFSAFSLYILAQGIGFGFLFGLLDVFTLMLIFGIAGILFFGMALVGFTMKDKTAMTFKKIIAIATGIMFMLMMIISITWLLTAFIWGYSQYFDMFYFLIFLIMGIVLLLYTAYDVYKIQKKSQFIDLENNKISFNYSMYFGFSLLTDLVGIIWIVAIFVLRYSRK